jgi:hypothetical protein
MSRRFAISPYSSPPPESMRGAFVRRWRRRFLPPWSELLAADSPPSGDPRPCWPYGRPQGEPPPHSPCSPSSLRRRRAPLAGEPWVTAGTACQARSLWPGAFLADVVAEVAPGPSVSHFGLG